ncbi:hypothetical protein EVAR_29979_1 [Eumeta japonica]|uniref:Uncharacterized protein n=1 Tax=Eumeta variegata TaxID=151549 RepID=A0A4C1VHL1_EUMVA|nr:hypothetical protein EVAR_29979_1 [Eumeta japonica]
MRCSTLKTSRRLVLLCVGLISNWCFARRFYTVFRLLPRGSLVLLQPSLCVCAPRLYGLVRSVSIYAFCGRSLLQRRPRPGLLLEDNAHVRYVIGRAPSVNIGGVIAPSFKYHRTVATLYPLYGRELVSYAISDEYSTSSKIFSGNHNTRPVLFTPCTDEELTAVSTLKITHGEGTSQDNSDKLKHV